MTINHRRIITLNNLQINSLTFKNILLIEDLYMEHKPLQYHNADHIKDLLHKFINTDYFNEIDVKHHNGFIMSIIYHDCVYSPKRNDNEERSIKRFYRMVRSNEYNNNYEYDEYIPNLILSTKYNNPQNTVDEKVLHDLDYSGFSDDIFKYKERMYDIWCEYKPHITYEEYKTNKIKFLNSLLKTKIYYYDHTYCEKLARKNIEYEIKYLS